MTVRGDLNKFKGTRAQVDQSKGAVKGRYLSPTAVEIPFDVAGVSDPKQLSELVSRSLRVIVDQINRILRERIEYVDSRGRVLNPGVTDDQGRVRRLRKVDQTVTVDELIADLEAQIDQLFSTDALGGGSTATLGTIGGTGPTVAGQNSWVEVDIGGGTFWLPGWQ